MIIDFHAHVFPDELAFKTIPAMAANINYLYTPVSDGTVAGLLKNMDEWGIDISVVQPVVTKQSQFLKTNEWVAGIVSDRIVGFGGFYPHTDDYKRDIDFVLSLGFKGLKLHPEYQDFVVDDRHMLEIYDYALSRGLILFFHAGFDEAFPPPANSTPEQFAKIAAAMRGGTIIASHLGGYKQWDDVEENLAGADIYLDTAMGFQYFSHEQFLRILKKHGADKILFGSDAPWSSAHDEIGHINSLPISDDEKAAILGGNAARLLSQSTATGRRPAS